MITIILAKVTMVLCVVIVGLMLSFKMMTSVDIRPHSWFMIGLGAMILVSPLMAAATIISYIIEFL